LAGDVGLRPDGRGAPPREPTAAPKNKDQGSPSRTLIRWSVQEIRRVAMRLAQRRVGPASPSPPSRHRLVRMGPRSPGGRTRRSHQAKIATVVLVLRHSDYDSLV